MAKILIDIPDEIWASIKHVEHTSYAERIILKATKEGTPLPKEHGWIPVSEKLPEETGWYIVTFRVYGGGYAVCELSYRKPENYWTDKDIFKKALSNDEILAWMPLPERYKDGE